MRYQKGQSGNPAGRPKGLKSKTLLTLRGKSEEIVKSVLAQAEEGCVQSQKMVLDRVIPTIKPVDPPIVLTGYPVNGSLIEKANFFIDAAGKGKLSVSQASVMVGAIASLCRIKEVEEIDRRLSEIESQIESGADGASEHPPAHSAITSLVPGNLKQS